MSKNPWNRVISWVGCVSRTAEVDEQAVGRLGAVLDNLHLDRLHDTYAQSEANESYYSEESYDFYAGDCKDILKVIDHPIPPDIRKAFNTDTISSLDGIHETLNVSNYRSKLGMLLYIEELVESFEKSLCDQNNVHVEQESDWERQTRLRGREEDECEADPIQFKLSLRKNPSSLKSFDLVALTGRRFGVVFNGTIVRTRDKWVYFTLDREKKLTTQALVKKFKREDRYDVAFGINRISYVRCHQALFEFTRSSFLQAALFPPSRIEPREPLIDATDFCNSPTEQCYLFGRTPNKSQIAALIGILESTCRPSPYNLFGPPGTGKTATIVEIITQILDRKPHFRMLVCGTSNESTDVLARALLKSNTLASQQLLRLSAANRMRDVSKDLRQVTRCMDQLIGKRQNLSSYSIIVTTCCLSATLKGLDFNYVFVDEAGSAKEPEALIPMTLVKLSGAVVLAGDPKQLGPVCQADETKKFGLGLSMLERLYQLKMYGGDLPMKGGNFDSSRITMLSVCYRCDQRLLTINNKMFYFGKLTFVNKSPTDLLRQMRTQSPLVFCKSNFGECERKPGGTSLFNDAEAKAVVKIATKLYRIGIGPEELGVASPYRAQVDHLKTKFECKKMCKCKIETMEKFQGDEREVMIITTVVTGGRTSAFFRDLRRFNVATSRAKWMMILVGDPQVLRQDDCWSEYVRHAAEITV